MRALLPLLLLAYPREFRSTYGAQFAADVADSPASRYPRIAFDMLAAGALMRADVLLRDLRYAARMLVKAPLFTVVVVGTLAIAIAGNAVVFSMLDAVVLKPLPYPQADRLAFLYAIPQRGAGAGGGLIVYFSTGLEDTRRIARRLTTADIAFAAYRQVSARSAAAAASPVAAAAVSPNYFPLLGARAQIGRLFDGSADERRREAVISDAFWRSHFGGAIDAVGRTVVLDGVAYTVRGVAPPGFRDLSYSELRSDDVWSVLPRKPPGGAPIPTPVVRIHAGVSLAAAQADLERAIASLHLQRTLNTAYRLRPVGDTIFGSARRFLITVFAAAAAVLLIASANIANLLLARGIGRDVEFAVRASLGAPPHRIGAQVFTELFVLFTCGAVAGVGLATAALPLVVALMPPFPRLADAAIDGTVVLYLCAVTALVMLAAGTAPVLAQVLRAPARALAKGPRTVSRRGGVRFALVAAEIAVAFALTVSAALLLRSFISVSNVDPGFSAAGVRIAVFNVRAGSSPTIAAAVARRVAALPGIETAAVASAVPFARGSMIFSSLRAAGSPAPHQVRFEDMTSVVSVTAPYFAALRIPMLRGRAFSDADGAHVAVVSASFARRTFGERDAVGRLLTDGSQPPLRIVGVAGDTRDALAQPPEPLVYVPHDGRARSFQIVARLRTEVPSFAHDVTAIAHELQPSGDPPRVFSLARTVADSTSRTRASLQLLGTLAVLALLLALAGIYSSVVYAVQSSYHEIGIRLSLGAGPLLVLRRVVGGALVQAAAGVAAGMAIAAATSRSLASELYATSPYDPAAFAGAAGVFVACALAAAASPAWRAARVDPALTLRYE